MKFVLKLLLVFLATRLLEADVDTGEVAYRKIGFNDESTEELTVKKGYPFEKHWTRTDDGYWLRLHRIPHGKNETEGKKNKTNKEVFFLQHGLTASSSNYVYLDGCLAFTLADQGYDVWMGNVRGNYYSRYHDIHANDSAEFWSFTFDDMAHYDLPTMIDTVLGLTKQESLWYVGHSQGTMMMLSKLSDDPEFGDKIKAFFALAPVAKLDTVFGPIRSFAKFFCGLKWVWDKTNIYKIPLPYHLLKKIVPILCKYIDKEYCDIVYAEMERITYTKWKLLPKILSELFTEGDACIKNIYHYCQAMDTGKFQKYDYGTLGNLLHYYQRTPPQYDMTNIMTNTWIFSGTKDILATQDNVDWIIEQLGDNVFGNWTLDGFNHLDFLWGTYTKTLVYDKILEIVRNETNKVEPKRNRFNV